MSLCVNSPIKVSQMGAASNGRKDRNKKSKSSNSALWLQACNHEPIPSVSRLSHQSVKDVVDGENSLAAALQSVKDNLYSVFIPPNSLLGISMLLAFESKCDRCIVDPTSKKQILKFFPLVAYTPN